jgi:hypothetical protein
MASAIPWWSVTNICFWYQVSLLPFCWILIYAIETWLCLQVGCSLLSGVILYSFHLKTCYGIFFVPEKTAFDCRLFLFLFATSVQQYFVFVKQAIPQFQTHFLLFIQVLSWSWVLLVCCVQLLCFKIRVSSCKLYSLEKSIGATTWTRVPWGSAKSEEWRQSEPCFRSWTTGNLS